MRRMPAARTDFASSAAAASPKNGSPSPTSTRSPRSVPPGSTTASGAITASVRRVAAGPIRSSAAEVTKSFSTEAGMRAVFSRRA